MDNAIRNTVIQEAPDVDNGYYDFDQNKYYFYVKDHLGNNRVVAREDGTVVQQTDYYPFGMPTLSSTGEGVQPYKFGGKEYDTNSGLDQYDFQARQYDPARITFTSMDPLAEKYYSISPYVYCDNNPLKYIDIDGKDVVILNAPEGAKGKGHMAAIIQDSQGQWYYMTMGATEGNFSKMFSEGVQGGMILMPLETNDQAEALSLARQDKGNAEYTETVSFKTSTEMDGRIYSNAADMKESVNKGDTKYKPLTNNCADAVVKTVSSGTGVEISTTSDPRPNSIMKDIRNNQAAIQKDINANVALEQALNKVTDKIKELIKSID